MDAGRENDSPPASRAYRFFFVFFNPVGLKKGQRSHNVDDDTNLTATNVNDTMDNPRKHRRNIKQNEYL